MLQGAMDIIAEMVSDDVIPQMDSRLLNEMH